MDSNLLNYIDEQDVTLVETKIPNSKLKGLYFDGTIVIDSEIDTEVERTCILAEEVGHYETSTGDLLDQSDLRSEKQEKRARQWAHSKLIDIDDLICSFRCGCRNRYEIADHLGVTEKFLAEAIKMMAEKHGDYKSIGHYVVCFEPLGILEKF